jgi:hypothetical protein
MKILRRGARADHGTRSVELKVAGVKWNPTAEAFDVTFSGAVSDFSTNARHHYWLRFSPDELVTLVRQLPEAGSSMQAEDFAEVFQKASPSLFKLQAMASGVRIAA